MDDDIRERAARAHRALGAAGQADLVWGHLALRDPEGRGVWMKAAGWGFDEIDASRILLVGWDGDVLAGDGARHVEYPIHTEIMRRRPEVTATVHSHPEDANVFASLGIPMPALSHEGVLFADPQVPRFTCTGDLVRTGELGSALADTLGSAPACLMPNHGIVAVGVDEAAAVMHAVLLTKACRMAVAAAGSGGAVSSSDPAEIAEKKRNVWPPAQLRAGYDYLVRLAERG
ncbi:class II aldolase/adducin family protein [Microbacterium sp. 22242]|uniref:class II aldolase/adducin family protein n=1 Tax=Microbacterium sp. 22242 TaxID=3453896 RepID=UPI003F84CD3E